MKQILQNLKTGTMELAELPAPAVARGMVLISMRMNADKSETGVRS